MFTINYKGHWIHGHCDTDTVTCDNKEFKSLHAAKCYITRLVGKKYVFYSVMNNYFLATAFKSKSKKAATAYAKEAATKTQQSHTVYKHSGFKNEPGCGVRVSVHHPDSRSVVG